MSRTRTFKDRVLRVVAAIPPGRTLSYQEVAAQAGRPKAARAVGAVMRANYRADIPCHRVVRSDGRIGGYNRGVDEKQRRLRVEGAIK